MGLTIQFDLAFLREVLGQIPQRPMPPAERFGVFVETLSARAQDWIARLVRLFGQPEAVPALYPAIVRKLY